MIKIYILLLAALFAAPLGVRAAEFSGAIVSGPDVRTETWEGKVLTATFKAGMCFEKNGKARGVLILRHASGNRDVYHLYGTYRGKDFDLSHTSGHVVQGSLASPSTMKGSVKIKGGPRLSMEGRRVLNVPLAAEDCAPLN